MIPAAPKLRFPEFKDPWKPGHAGDAFKNSRAKGAAGLPIYSVTMDRGLVRRDSMDRQMAADAADNQNLRAQRGDVVYNMMRMWQGAVGLAHEECMVSPAYVVLSPREHTSPQFFDQWFKAKRMLYLLGAYSFGITSDRLRLYADDFVRIPLHMPGLPEQQKIAAFLSSIDSKLTALTAMQSAIRRYKIGLMQQLFSQKIRFTKGNGNAFPDWQETRLGNILRVKKLRNRKGRFLRNDVLSVSGEFGIVNQIEHLGRSYAGESLDNYHTVETGDIVYTKSPLKSNPYGIIKVNKGKPGIVSTLYAVYEVREGYSGDFIDRYFELDENLNRYLEPLVHKGAKNDMKISSERVLIDPITVPCIEEQQKIADALSALDAKIQALTDQVTKLQTFKKGLLQQMFV